MRLSRSSLELFFGPTRPWALSPLLPAAGRAVVFWMVGWMGGGWALASGEGGPGTGV
jgi:hypothetical protein